MVGEVVGDAKCGYIEAENGFDGDFGVAHPVVFFHGREFSTGWG